MAAHPIVGSWVQDNVPAEPGTFLSYLAFHADGTYTAVNPYAGTGTGVWRATGERTGDATVKYLNIGHERGGCADGTLTVRATFEVDATGTAFTWRAAIEVRDLDGTILDSYTNISIGTRLEIEPKAAVSTPAGGTPTR